MNTIETSTETSINVQRLILLLNVSWDALQASSSLAHGS